MGLESQKFYVFFPCNPMEPFISGVRHKLTRKIRAMICLHDSSEVIARTQ